MISDSDSSSIQLGTRLTVEIEDIAFGGEGVARVDGLVIFVPFVAIGETIETEITEVKNQYARGQLLSILNPAPERVEAPCPYFTQCGGCQYQHLNYDTQLTVKHRQIQEIFQRIGKFSPEVVEPIIPCPSPYGYRNRVMFRAQWDKFRKRMGVGYLRRESRLIVDVEECLIAEPELNEALTHARIDPPRKQGVKLVFRKYPEDWILPEHSFFQNNHHLLPELVNTVRERIRQAGVRHLIDTYCGIGFFGIEVSDAVESFVGIELDKSAINAARENLVKRNISNGEFLYGKTEELLPEALKKFSADHTSVILDPPRRGCHSEGLDLLKQTAPKQIIYVSCHPATLARDLNNLCDSGVYELKKMIPLDMFPQTQHVECVADLRRIGTLNTEEKKHSD
ncbi:MAG TPA: class I SAM-dependent RNA methyltransferase [Verrucomicrobiales bacterium]|nr:class I SAM-dependent RNA methyltransferase [Verrucomicrobiales bacterium]